MTGRRRMIASLWATTMLFLGNACGEQERLVRPSETPEEPRLLPSPRREYRSEDVGDGEYRFWPRSLPVEPGIPYVFDTGHCGLAHLTDFDGSFWDPLPDAPRSLLINQSLGTMTLIEDDQAVYEASTGEQVRLLRIDGPMVTYPCR
jgi:hypothetical protein